MAMRPAARTWEAFVAELGHLAEEHEDCSNRLEHLFTEAPPTSFDEKPAALSAITNLLKEIWEGPLDNAAVFKLLSEHILVRTFLVSSLAGAHPRCPDG